MLRVIVGVCPSLSAMALTGTPWFINNEACECLKMWGEMIFIPDIIVPNTFSVPNVFIP